MNIFVRTRLHAPWHISYLYVVNSRRHVVEHRTLCGKWVEINQAEGMIVQAEEMMGACRRCVQGQTRKERRAA